MSNGDSFNDSLDVILQEGCASASLLQRRLRIGHKQAVEILNRMVKEGYIRETKGALPYVIDWWAFDNKRTARERGTDDRFNVENTSQVDDPEC